MPVDPSWLVDVIWLTPAMRPNCRSSGVATDEAIVSGLAPGSPALTLITGYSTCGIGATGSRVYASMPAINRPMASNDVATGRRINGAEMFIFPHPERSEGSLLASTISHSLRNAQLLWPGKWQSDLCGTGTLLPIHAQNRRENGALPCLCPH